MFKTNIVKALYFNVYFWYTHIHVSLLCIFFLWGFKKITLTGYWIGDTHYQCAEEILKKWVVFIILIVTCNLANLHFTNNKLGWFIVIVTIVFGWMLLGNHIIHVSIIYSPTEYKKSKVYRCARYFETCKRVISKA